ncbi:MAG: hypothetical protein IH571_00115 [Acholeplasmataceae bacterium]|nr:hypothetical protein [Acholeplasmataceae bacterium]
MKKLIWSVDYKKKIFYIIIHGRKIGFHLTNRLSKTFLSYLRKGVMVDFAITERKKRIDNAYVYQVAYFNQIVTLRPFTVHYDLKKLRHEMQTVLKNNKNYLFIDFEMTMPGHDPKSFKSEIIQVGYVLAEARGPVKLSEGFYVLPKENKTLSRRTKKFLNLDEEQFFKEAMHFDVLYNKLKHIMTAYDPKLVVWGKNDITALNDSYALHQKRRLTEDLQFIDLLKLHKDYFNLKDDLGLFKAYKTYYQLDFEQEHDAKDDALVTKYVFDAFIQSM